MDGEIVERVREKGLDGSDRFPAQRGMYFVRPTGGISFSHELALVISACQCRTSLV